MIKITQRNTLSRALTCFLFIFSFAASIEAQEPKPGPSKSITIPSIKESKLKNGLTISVVEKRNVPIVTIQLLFPDGANFEEPEKAGLSDITLSMLTKGTKNRTAEQISQQIEYLGGSIYSSADWNNSEVTISVTSDKAEEALSILADVVINPIFPQTELDLLKSQSVNNLTYNLTQPGFLSTYAASTFSFDEHPVNGTIPSISSITRDDTTKFYNDISVPWGSVLIFAGDITSAKASQLAEKYFGKWRDEQNNDKKTEIVAMMTQSPNGEKLGVSSVNTKISNVSRILVIDLPNSGQASVSYVKKVPGGRGFEDGENISFDKYYHASLLNSLLGGGYSSRLNQEIRIKRGLSYGAGSGFVWRWMDSNFSTRTQTKNESASEVAELVYNEIKRLAEGTISTSELDPRKSVLTGGFGRDLETTEGLVNAIADLHTFSIPKQELNSYMKKINSVTDKQIKEFAKANLLGGDFIIVGEYAKFKDDLAKRFPNIKPVIIPADELDINKPNLRK